jgi:hypothetical protein
MLQHILNHAALAVARLAAQFSDASLFKGMITALVNEVQAAEDGLYQLLLTRDIENATDAALDSIGLLLGAPVRGAQTEDQYRDRVKAQVLINKSYGTFSDVYAVGPRIVEVWATAGQPKVIEDYASCAYTIGCTPVGSIVNATVDAQELAFILDDMNSAGVRGIVLSQTQSAATSFCFQHGPGLGFGAGHFVGAYDAGKSH